MTKGDKMAEKIYASIDGQQIEATGELLKQILDNQAAAIADTEAENAAKKAKSAARLSVLTRLGLTAEEAALILG